MSSSAGGGASSAPTHTTESIADRKKSRELAEARQSGNVAPEVDVKTGAMINPHNPEFITKRPWYLGGNDDGPSLDHQADQRLDKDRIEHSMALADRFVKQHRKEQKELREKGQFQIGMWVEALKNNKQPYRICQIIKIAKKGTVYDLKYEDGTIERKVKFKPNKKVGFMDKPRIRMTKMGARSIEVDATLHGKQTFDSKRDKYHGYDVDTHTKRVEKIYKERDDLRREARKKTTKEKQKEKDGDDEKKKKSNDPPSDSDSDLDSDVGSDDDSDDEFVQRDEDDKVHTSRLARQGGVGGAQMKVTARNLRIREDTAKYLRNLDLNSAYYDPKSRSMRDNPNPEIPAEESQFAGDNFARISGDAVQLADTQLFAWDAAEKGGVSELHPQATPSQAELLKKQFKSKSADLKLQRKKKVLDKYGGAEYLDGSSGLADAVDSMDGSDSKKAAAVNDRSEVAAKERKIRFGVSTAAEEYSRDGRLLKGGPESKVKRMALKSKYEEDVFINGHTTVWGSYFHVGAFQWGYADDHSLIRNSYCTGENGRIANDESNTMRYGTGMAGSAALAQARVMLKAMPSGEKSSKLSKLSNSNKSKLYGEVDPTTVGNLDESKVQAALKKMSKSHDDSSDRKRKYNSINADVDVTEEEMEAYRLHKERSSDPMAKISSEEVLDYK